LESAGVRRSKIAMGIPFAHGPKKKTGLGSLAVITVTLMITPPDKYPLPNKTFQMASMIAWFFQKFTSSKVITKFLSLRRTSQKQQL
jgi:hypothetical protein